MSRLEKTVETIDLKSVDRLACILGAFDEKYASSGMAGMLDLVLALEWVRDNIASFELITWVLGHCTTTDEARELLEHTNITDEAFNDRLPPSQLHWMIADRDSCIVLEMMADGMHIHDNPVGILTNNPPFPFHIVNLANHMAMSPEQPVSDKQPAHITSANIRDNTFFIIRTPYFI